MTGLIDYIQADFREVDTCTQQGIEWGFYRITGDQELSGTAGVIGNGVLDIGFSAWGMTRLVPGNNLLGGGKYNSRWYSNEKHSGSPHWQRGYQDMSRGVLGTEIYFNLDKIYNIYNGVRHVDQ